MKKCFECETIEDIQEHHVVPRSRGGTKTVTLCYECHMKAHGRSGKGLNHSRLVKEGMQRARERGVKFGNPHWEEKIDKAQEARRAQGKATVDKYGALIVSLRDSGLSYQKIADKLTMMEIPTPSRKTRWWSAKSVQNIYKKSQENK